MGGYTKLFPEILTSTIWAESSDTRVVWITMLAFSDRDGVVSTSIPGLARLANVSEDACREALSIFLQPDEDSRDRMHGGTGDGRRIEPVEGGYRLINYQKYRAKLSREDRREYKTQKQREYRAKKTQRYESSMSTCGQNGHIAEAEAEAEAEARTARACEAWVEKWEQRWPGELAQLSPAQIAKLEAHERQHGTEELVERMDRYLAAMDGWLIENRHPLGRFVNSVEKYGPPPKTALEEASEMFLASVKGGGDD